MPPEERIYGDNTLLKTCDSEIGECPLGSVFFTGFPSTYIHRFSDKGLFASPIHVSREVKRPSAGE